MKILAMILLVFSNISSGWVLHDCWFGTNIKSGLSSVLLFIPIAIITILAGWLLKGHYWGLYILPVLVVIDAILKLIGKR